MTDDKDSAVLAERVERVTKWLDGGCSTWGTPAQDIREVINALRQPTQSDALRAENERLRAALEAIEAEDQRVTQSQMAHLKQTLKEQSEIREAAKWSS